MKNFKIAFLALAIATSFAACKGEAEKTADSPVVDSPAVVDSPMVDSPKADSPKADTTAKM